MKIIADTNVLLRAVLGDDSEQSRAARIALSSAEQVVLSRHALCEMVWVLNRSYKLPRADIAKVVIGLLNAKNVITDHAAVDAGFKAMDDGADFADGVIDYEGRWLGGETFVSFDKRAIMALEKQGRGVKLLG